MKTILILFIFFVSIASVSSQTIKEDFDFDIYGQIRDVAIRNNIVAIAGGTGIQVGNKLYSSIAVSIKKDGKWTQLPRTIERNGNQDTLLANGQIKVRIDSKGNIWVTGVSLFKFDGTKWTEYLIDDEFKGRRRFQHFLLDKNDKIYLTSDAERYKTDSIRFSEIHSFDNNQFKSILKYDDDTKLSMNQGFTRVRPFVELQDSSILLAHNTIVLEDERVVDLTQIVNDGSINQHLITAPDGVKLALKSITDIIQDKDGTIWFGLFLGMKNLEENCCTGITRTTDFINYYPLTKEAGMPHYSPNQPYSINALKELPNGDILFMTNQNDLTLFRHNYDSKSVSRIHWIDIMKNAVMIKKSSKNPNYPQEWYENVLSVLNSNQAKNTSHSPFQLIATTEDGTMYLVFNDYLLEIPIESITSVPQLNTSSVLYPNPSIEFVKVESSKEISYVTITNVLGQRIVLENIGNGSYSTTNVPSGFYNLLVTYTDNSIESHSFIRK
ncbi:MAG: T9SS type A sorting domain-containing protein [Candidatus Kapabacteria bacterium]|nr:T9SS type A sorting domain-containing protein [Candidatus Kapabacteria bacterium]